MKNTLHLTRKLRAGTALQALALIGAGVGMTAVAAPAVAQDYTTGALVGTVVDETGARVSGGTVTVRSAAQGFERTAPISADGAFRVQALPTGVYTVTVSAEGYPATATENVRVNPGANNTYNFTVNSGDVLAGGEIVVQGTAERVNDFGSNTGGLTIGDVSELLNTTPIARNQTALILLSPGTSSGDTAFGNLASIGGATVAENAYYVNGLNVTNFRNFVGSSNPPIEFYQSLDVKLYGLSAEFGRALGGFTTAVTKSGSNEFQAGALVAYAPDGTRSTAPNTYAALNDTDYTEDLEANFYLSGPIIKDRLFFYGLYNPNYTKTADTSLLSNQRLTRSTDSPFYGGKLDFIITDGHRLEGTYFNNSQTNYTDYAAVDPASGAIGADLGTLVQKFGGDNFVGRYTGQFTDWLTLSAAYGEAHDNQSANLSTQVAYISSQLSGASQVARGLTTANSSDEDVRKFYRADADVYVNLLGEHHFRFGYEREDLSSTTNTSYAGNGYRYILTPNYILRYFYQNIGTWESRNESFYIQDSWSLLNDRLNLQLGLRNDRFSNDSLTGTYFESGDQWGPRLGASVDVFGDNRTTVRGSWSRYFLPVATNTNIRLGGAELYYRQAFNYPAGVSSSVYDANGLPAGMTFDQYGDIEGLSSFYAGSVTCPAGSPNAGERCVTIYDDGQPGATDTLVSSTLQPSYTDEWTVGVEHRFGDWNVSLTYLNRRLGRTLDDVAIDAAVLDYCADEGIVGCDAAFTGFHQYVLANPGSDITVRLNGDCAVDPRQCEVATLTAEQLGYPEAVRNYDSVIFQFNKAYADGWGLGGSYSYTRLRGNYEGAVKSDNGQDDAGLTQDFDQPGLLDGAYGVLANQRAHAFKLFGTFEVAENFRIGANILLESPRKFSCIGVHPTDAFAAAYQAASYYCSQPQFADRPSVGGSYLVERGTAFESDWRRQVDMNFHYDISALPGSFISLDVFNIFNFQSKLDYQEFGDLSDGSPNQVYGEVLSYQTPRYLRFTIGMRFGGEY